jgi:hypothetical protein
MKYCYLACTLLLAACSSQNENYFQTHPLALQNALQQCPEKHPSQLSCEKLESIGKTINELAYQLQVSPQGFGKKILALQETMARQKADLALKKNESLQASYDENALLLSQYLAVVKWLESPES